MIEIAERVDHIVLFSGDGSYRSLLEAVQRRGARVTVVSTIANSSATIADELRRQADSFVDLNSLRDDIARARNSRPAQNDEDDDDYYDDDFDDDDDFIDEEDDVQTATGRN